MRIEQQPLYRCGFTLAGRCLPFLGDRKYGDVKTLTQAAILLGGAKPLD